MNIVFHILDLNMVQADCEAGFKDWCLTTCFLKCEKVNCIYPVQHRIYETAKNLVVLRRAVCLHVVKTPTDMPLVFDFDLSVVFFFIFFSMFFFFQS